MVKVFGLDHAPQAPKEPPVPFLNAKALDIDPDGMAFLRAVIRPDFEREESVLPALRKEPAPCESVSQNQAEPPKTPIRAEAPAA
jgi:hypothetical protein